MTIYEAIRILCEVHTKWKIPTGFSVCQSPRDTGDRTDVEYFEAWGVLRSYVGLPTEPDDGSGWLSEDEVDAQAKLEAEVREIEAMMWRQAAARAVPSKKPKPLLRVVDPNDPHKAPF